LKKGDTLQGRGGTVYETFSPAQMLHILSAESSQNFPKNSWAKISKIRTLSVKRLGEKIGKASANEFEMEIKGLNEIITA
jgi:mRNA interferase MazF